MADSQRIEELRRRVQTDPASIAFAQLAEECRRAGHYQESVDVCRAGLELHPGYLSARVTLGRALIELEHVLKSAPENLAAIRGLADIHHRQGSLAEALAQYRAALALARNDPDLQRTVDELARQVEPPRPPSSADGLSFEEMQNEFLQNLEPPPPPPPQPVRSSPAPQLVTAPPVDALPVDAPAVVTSPLLSPPTVSEPEPVATLVPEPEPEAAPAIVRPDSVDVAAPPQDSAERAQALKQIAALEPWLDALHGSSAKPRA